MTTKPNKKKQAETLVLAAMRKRNMAQRLLEEAEEDLVKSRMLMREVENK